MKQNLFEILNGQRHTPDLIEIGPGFIGIVIQIRSLEDKKYGADRPLEIVEPGNVGVWNQAMDAGAYVIDKYFFKIVYVKHNNDFEGVLNIAAENGTKLTIALSAKLFLNDAEAINCISRIPFSIASEYSEKQKVISLDPIIKAGLIDLYTKEINNATLDRSTLKLDASPERSEPLLRVYIEDMTRRVMERVKNSGITVHISINSVTATIVV